MNIRKVAHRKALGSIAAAASLVASVASGADASITATQAQKSYAIGPGPLGVALNRFARESGLLVSFDAAVVAGKSTSGLNGVYDADAGLRALLAGTGLEAATSGNNAYVVRNAPAAKTLETIRVEAVRLDDGFKANDQTSATKSLLSIRETPQAISVVTRESIDSRFALNQQAALETAAGVTSSGGAGAFAGRAQPTHERTYFRGEGADQREDGFAVPTGYFSPDLVVFDRIEAVKGPSSVLYGQGSAGGFINRVRKKPLSEFEASTSVIDGSYDLARFEGDITGPLTDSGAVRGRLTGAYEQGDSFVDGVKSDIFVVAPSIEADLTDTTKVLAQILYQRDRYITNPGVILHLNEDASRWVPVDVPRSQFNSGRGATLDDSRNNVKMAALQLDQHINDRWLASLRLNWNVVDTNYFSDRNAYGFQPGGDTSVYTSAINMDEEVLSGELRVNGKFDLFGREHQVVFGVESEHEKYDRMLAYNYIGTANIYTTDFNSFPFVSPKDTTGGLTLTRAKHDQEGVYGQVILSPAERLKVMFGTRYDSSKQGLGERFTGTSLDQLGTHAMTSRFGVVYDLTKNFSAYVSAAQSFTPNSAKNRNNEILTPERGLIYEVGLKADLADDRLSFSTAIYRLDRKHVAIDDPANGPGQQFSISAGVQRNDGFEVEVNGRPLPGLTLSVAGTLVDSEYIDRDDPNFGRTPRYIAPWQANLFTTYEVQSGPLKGFGFGGGLTAVGNRPVRDEFAATSKGYKRVDLTAYYYGFDHMRLSLLIRNVTDEKYIERPTFQGYGAMWGAPTSVLARLEYTF